jgi:hypothetical protein
MLLVEKIGLFAVEGSGTHNYQMNWLRMMYTDFKETMNESPLYRFGFGAFLCICVGELIGTLLCINTLPMSQCSVMIVFAVPTTPIGTILAALTIQYIVCAYMRKPVLPRTLADVKKASPSITPKADDMPQDTSFEGTNPLKVARIAITPQKVRSGATAPPVPPAPQKARRVLDEDFTDVNPMRAEGTGLV